MKYVLLPSKVILMNFLHRNYPYFSRVFYNQKIQIEFDVSNLRKTYIRIYLNNFNSYFSFQMLASARWDIRLRRFDVIFSPTIIPLGVGNRSFGWQFISDNLALQNQTLYKPCQFNSDSFTWLCWPLDGSLSNHHCICRCLLQVRFNII